MLVLLAATATHDLVRYYPPGATIATARSGQAGPLFPQPHLIYNTAMVWAATALLVATLSRMSGLYRLQSAVPGRGHPPADPTQPLVQLEGGAVPTRST